MLVKEYRTRHVPASFLYLACSVAYFAFSGLYFLSFGLTFYSKTNDSARTILIPKLAKYQFLVIILNYPSLLIIKAIACFAIGSLFMMGNIKSVQQLTLRILAATIISTELLLGLCIQIQSLVWKSWACLMLLLCTPMILPMNTRTLASLRPISIIKQYSSDQPLSERV